jgi:hypothetical protein
MGGGSGAVVDGAGQMVVRLDWCEVVWPCPSGLGLGVGSWVGVARGEGGRVGGRLEGRLEGRLCRPDHSEALSLGVSVSSSVLGLGLGLRLGNAMVLAMASVACWLLAINLPLGPRVGNVRLPAGMALILRVLGCFV